MIQNWLGNRPRMPCVLNIADGPKLWDNRPRLRFLFIQWMDFSTMQVSNRPKSEVEDEETKKLGSEAVETRSNIWENERKSLPKPSHFKTGCVCKECQRQTRACVFLGKGDGGSVKKRNNLLNIDRKRVKYWFWIMEMRSSIALLRNRPDEEKTASSISKLRNWGLKNCRNKREKTWEWEAGNHWVEMKFKQSRKQLSKMWTAEERASELLEFATVSNGLKPHRIKSLQWSDI